MKKCRYVIQDGSTVAFEALYTGRIVFSFSSWNGDGISIEDVRPLLHLFQSANDFLSLWSRRIEFKTESRNEIFSLNYKENYVQFLKECGVDVDDFEK